MQHSQRVHIVNCRWNRLEPVLGKREFFQKPKLANRWLELHDLVIVQVQLFQRHHGLHVR